MKSTTILFVLSLAITLIGCGVKAVRFGNHKPNIDQNFYRVFIDQYGDYYPEKTISNSKLKSAGSSLNNLYERDVELFSPHLHDLTLDPTQSISFNKFQEELIRYHGVEINKRMRGANATSITFILVGYNNKYEDASTKLQALRRKINSILDANLSKTFIVELYWDGKSMMFGIDAVSIFGNAQANSYNVGVQLRLLLNQIGDANHIYFISHSLGANVVTECLFNQVTKLQDDSSMGEESVLLSLQQKYMDAKYILNRSKQYYAAVVAPAIPGVYTFIDYGRRGYAFDRSRDNYHIIGGINTHDRVLNKFIGATTLFGSTSFGCRRDEVANTFDLFAREYDRNKIDTVDFSFRHEKRHGLEYYMHAEQYESLLKKLYVIN